MTLFQHQGLDCEKLNSPSLQAHYDYLTVFIYTRTVLTMCVDVSSSSEGDRSTALAAASELNGFGHLDLKCQIIMSQTWVT